LPPKLLLCPGRDPKNHAPKGLLKKKQAPLLKTEDGKWPAYLVSTYKYKNYIGNIVANRRGARARKKTALLYAQEPRRDGRFL